MPFKKTWNKKKSTVRKWKPKVSRIARAVKNPNISRGVYFFKRMTNLQGSSLTNVDTIRLKKDSTNKYISFDNGSAVAGNVVYGAGSLAFSLNSIPNYNEFTSLFDNYQIRKVIVKIIPYPCSAESYQSGSSYPNWAPLIHYAIDHDDHTMPTPDEAGIQELQQYQSYKYARLVAGRPITIVIKPRTEGVVQNSSIATVAGTSLSRNTWIDCAQVDIPYFGLKFLCEGVSPAANYYTLPMRCEAIYYFKFKGVR